MFEYSDAHIKSFIFNFQAYTSATNKRTIKKQLDRRWSLLFIPDVSRFWKLRLPCAGNRAAGDVISSSTPWVLINPSNKNPMEWWGMSIVSPLRYGFIIDLSATRALKSCISIFSNIWGSKTLTRTIALSCKARYIESETNTNTLTMPVYILSSTFFFFLVSNKDVYSRTPPHAESHKTKKKITEKEDKKERKDTNYKGES